VGVAGVPGAHPPRNPTRPGSNGADRRRATPARPTGPLWETRRVGHGVRVTELFGIGTKYEIACGGRQRLAVVVHKDGTRELYAFEPGEHGEPSAVIRLDEDEAKRVAAVLSGTFFSD
jgi:hypothetical protein